MENKRLKFIIVYGLPGSGKTTLCQKVSELIPDVKYINIGADKLFKTDETVVITKRLFQKEYNVITEGIFPNINYRKSLAKEFKDTHDCICVYNYEALSILAKRRNRTEHEYWQLLKIMHILYMPPTDIIMDEPNFEKRVEYIKNLFSNE